MADLYNSYSSPGDPGGGRDATKFYAYDAKQHADAINTNTHTRPQSGLFASLPTAGNAGLLYFATDAGIILRDNGTSWDIADGSGQPAFTSPPTSGWSTTTLGAASVAASLGGRLFTMPASDATPRIEYRTLSPASNYTWTTCIDQNMDAAAGTSYIGMFVRNSTSANATFFGSSITNAALFLHVDTCSTSNIQAGNTTNRAASILLGGIPKWTRIRDDSTNRYYEYSYNGINWTTFYSEGRTTYITPDQIGWGGANNGNTGRTNYALLRSFS